MKFPSILVFCLLVFLACTNAQPNTPICTSGIASAVNKVTSRPEFANSNWGIYSKAFFPSAPGQLPYTYNLFSSNIDTPLIPASNTKLFTGIATFLKYGPANQFETKFIGDVPVAGNSDVWSTPTVTGSLPSGRLYPRAVGTSAGIMYLFGGQITSTTVSNDMYTLDTNTNVWTLLTVSGTRPTARYAQTQVLTPDESTIFIFGGYASVRLNDMAKFDIATKTWKPLATTGTKPAVRTLAGGVATRFGTVIIFGGGQGSIAFFNDINKYNIATDAWVPTTVKGTPPSPRSGVTAVLTKDNIMVIFGGHYQTTPYNDVFQYDTFTDTWLTIAKPAGVAPPARLDHSAIFTSDNFMVIFGGSNDNNGLFNDVVKYSVDENKWYTSPVQGTIPPRNFGPVAIFNNKTQNMVVWGGGSGSSYFSTVYKLQYYPPSNAPDVTIDTLCVVASADPYLTTAQVSQTLNSLRARGVVAINNLYVDSTAYVGQTVPASWPLDFVTATPVGGFMADRNFAGFSVSPASTAGNPAIIKFNSPEDVNSVPYVNNAVTSSSGTSVSVAYDATYTKLVISGTIAVGAAARTFSPAIYSAEKYFQGRLQYYLGQNGISYTNSILGACPISSPVAATVKSQTLDSLMYTTLQESDNINSEQFARRLGADAVVKTGNNLLDGIAEVKRVINDQLGGVNLNQVIINDGCGLSYSNKFTARTTVQLLEQMDRLPSNTTFKSYLPLAGYSGTLATRFPSGEAGRGIVRAKTGSLTGVSALSGYLQKTDVNEPRQIFSILLNSPSSVSSTTLRRGIDDIVNIFARWDSQC